MSERTLEPFEGCLDFVVLSRIAIAARRLWSVAQRNRVLIATLAPVMLSAAFEAAEEAWR
jgi:hypothetical protein